MSYFSQAATAIWQWICWCGVTLFLVSGFLLVSPVLAVWLALDFLPKRKPRPLKTSSQPTRKLQLPEREGGDVYVVNPDGSRILLEPLEVSIMAEKWLGVVKGAYVYEKTRLRGDTEGAQPRL